MAPGRYQSLSMPKDSRRYSYIERIYDARWSIMAVVLTFICTWTFTSRTQRHDNITRLQLRDRTQTFRYNRTYAEGTIAADTAWEAIFPEHGGFFQHPDIAPERSGFSVFHQLHCLDSIRKSYWINFEAARTPKAADKSTKENARDANHMLGPAHIRHCIDMLRQSLMCQADLTVEPVDPVIQASKGWGIPHQCKDFSQLMQFMKMWEGMDRR